MMLIAGCTTTPEYGSRGPGEQWQVVHADDPDRVESCEDSVEEQRSWGWASQLVLVNDDRSVDELIVGPVAISQDKQTIEVPYFIVSKQRVSGSLSFTASPANGYSLPEKWVGGIKHELEVLNGSISGYYILPVIGVPTDGVLATWSKTE